MSAATLRARGKKNLMDKLIARVNKHRPRSEDKGTFELVRSATEVLSSVKYTLTTGIRTFDTVTGGFPFGRITEMYGMDASGKSAMAVRAAVRAQERFIYERILDADGAISFRRIDDANVYVLYIDNEQSLHKDDEELIGGNHLDIMIGRCDTVDSMFMMIEEVIDGVAEEEKDSGQPAFVVVIVDTIASTASKEEMTQEWGKEDYTRQPKQLRQGFRKITRKIARQNVCVICTNQVSDRFDVARYGPKSSTPQDGDFSTFGGRALKYYATLRIFMYSMKTKLQLKERVKGAGPDGLVIGFKTTKNRLVKPYREARIALLFGRTAATPNYQPKPGEKVGGYHDLYSMLETFIQLGMAEVDTGSITFKLSKFGVKPTTFGANVSLEDDDDGPRAKKHPKIATKNEWIGFYEAHQADFDALWDKATDLMFSTEAPPSKDGDEDEDESENNGDNPEEI